MTDAAHPPAHDRVLKTACVVGVLLLAAAFAWTFHRMILRWEKPGSYYSHGWLVPLVAVLLFWMRRKQLAASDRAPSLSGLLLLAPSLLLHVAGVAFDAGFVSGFALVGTLMGLVLTLFGARFFRLAAFPLLVLVFMIPMPEVLIEKISFTMKLMAAATASRIVDLLGITVIREGSIIHLAPFHFTGDFQRLIVDDVCSGLKYLISLTAFGAVFAACFSHVRTWAKPILFVLSVPVAFVANVIRVTLMVLVSYFWGVQVIENDILHYGLGILVFVSAYLFLFLLDTLMAKGLRLGSPPDAPAAASPTARRVAPSRALLGGLLAALAVTAALSGFFAWPRKAEPAGPLLQKMPRLIGDWRATEGSVSSHEKAILGTEDVLALHYLDSHDRQIRLLLVIARQSMKRTHPPEQCYTGEGYRRLSSRDVSCNLEGRPPVMMREVLFERSEKLRLVYYLYKSGPSTHTSYWAHQAGVAFRKISGRPADDILVRFDITASPSDVETARDTITGFLESCLPAILDSLP